MDKAAKIQHLEDVVETLRERIRELESAFVYGEEDLAHVRFGLTKTEGRVLSALMKRDWMTKPGLMTVMYGHADPDQDIPQIGIIDVFLCRLRKKLRAHGVKIETIWGDGLRILPGDKEKIQRFLSESANPPGDEVSDVVMN